MRAENWWESEGTPIGLDSITELLGDPEIGIKATNAKKGEVIEIPNSISFVWPRNAPNEFVKFFYDGGKLSFKCIDEKQIDIAKDLASNIGAKVQGDEGEFYEISPIANTKQIIDTPKRPEWNKYATILGIIVGTLAVIIKYVFLD